MTDFYLITGFLGAGKTSFLKEFVRLFEGKKISIIVNEFGKENIDGHLLENLKAKLATIINGSIFCVCRLEDFEKALDEMLRESPDVLLVESSGLSDPSAINQILKRRDPGSLINYKGCICIADAVNIKKVISTSVVSQKQLAIAGTVVINKIDLTNDLEETKNLIKAHNPNAQIVESAFGAFSPPAHDLLLNPGCYGDSSSEPGRRDLTLQSYLIEVDPAMSLKDLKAFIGLIVDQTYRIKGFVSLNEGNFFVDCVSDKLQVTPTDKATGQPNRIVALSGKGMPTRAAIRDAVKAYEAYEISMES